MKPRLTLCVMLFGLWLIPLLGQETVKTPGTRAVRFYKNAEQALLERDYKEAIQLFKKALNLNPDLTAAYRGIGSSYELMGKYREAVTNYETVLKRDTMFSRAIYYQIGELYYKLNEAPKALFYFKKFEELQDYQLDAFGLTAEKERLQEDALIEKLYGSIRACEVSLDSLKFVNITKVTNLGKSINSKSNEYFPFLSNNQRLLFFTRQKNEKEDENLHYTTFEENKWRTASQVGKINTSSSEGMSTLVRDGRKMFFTACEREGVMGSCDIWEALVQGNEVKSISQPEGYTNSNAWESQAAISCDGSTLYFASNREGGIGGTDIWYTERQSDGSWGYPANMGPKINTTADEEAPFITNDGKTLYFSSTGHLGMGEQDIFLSWLDDASGEWTVPFNLGPPVNSAYRELGFFLSADGKTGFFASNRPEGLGGMDIYKFDLSEKLYSDPITFVEGYVRDSIIHIPVQTTININGRNAIQSDEDGRFFLCVGADEILDMETITKGYKPFHNQFVIPEWNNKFFYTIELLLQPTITFIGNQPDPLSVGIDSTDMEEDLRTTKEYRHLVYFGFDNTLLTLEESAKMDKFLSALSGKDVARVEVIGFADDVGDDIYNLKLSEERAKQSAVYLMDQGYPVNKISLEGRGEIKDSSPKKKNRRVEIKIIIYE